MTPAIPLGTDEPTTKMTNCADHAGVDLASWWALRRAARGALRHHDNELFTDGGRAVPDWIAQACAELLASGHLASDAADQLLILTASGSAALAGGQP